MNFNDLSAYLDAQLNEGIPGFDVAICHHGEIVYRHMSGTCDYEKKKPVSRDTRYWLYSCTKPITMTAAMQCVEKGLLDLEQAVGYYIPAFQHMTVQTPEGVRPAQNVMKVKHLMSMTSGLGYSLTTPALLEAMRDQNASTKTLVEAMAKEPLYFEPGTDYKYSLGHDVMGRVIEVVTGETFGGYLKKNIFDPLGMTDSTFRETPELRQALAAEFRYDNETHTSKPAPFRNEDILSACYESGGGGLISSVEDYAKFVGAMSCKGVAPNGYRVLGMDAINKMRTPLLTDEIAEKHFSKYKLGYNYGLGVRTMKYPEMCGAKSPIGEFGWDGAAGSFALMDTENEIGIFYAQQVRACNYAYFTVHMKLRDMAYEILLGK